MAQTQRRFAIEEEFFFVHSATGDLVADGLNRVYPDEHLMPPMVMREMWKSQIEVASLEECHSINQLRKDATSQRTVVINAAARQGFDLIASGRHPFSTSENQRLANESYQARRDQRFQYLNKDLDYQILASGLHVHVHIEEDDEKQDINVRKQRAVEVINRLIRDIYTLSALSVNSPYGFSKDAGFASSRMLAYVSKIPRVAVDYPDHLQSITIPGPSSEGWYDVIRGDVQASERLPTIEFRTPDSVDNLEDAILIACLAKAMVETSIYEREQNQPFVIPELATLQKAKEIGAKFGIEHLLMDVDNKRLLPAADYLLDIFLPRLRRALEVNGDWDYALEGINRLLLEGTGARRQRNFFHTAKRDLGETLAWPALVRELVRSTTRGITPQVHPDATSKPEIRQKTNPAA